MWGVKKAYSKKYTETVHHTIWGAVQKPYALLSVFYMVFAIILYEKTI